MPVSIQSVSRRDFLRTCSVVLGAIAMPKLVSAGIAPMSPGYDRVALLSDVHVSGGLIGTMARRLSVAVGQVLALPQRPQTVLVAGDCAHLWGNAGDYREYVRRIQPLVDARLPLHMTMGNHDHRERFWEALPNEMVDANLSLRRQSMVVPGERANWFMLDSLNRTNRSAGELGRDQLEWLAAELDAHADKPALVMLHHDPIRNGGKGSLADSGDLLAITRPRKQVKALFFGHTHVWNVARDSSGLHLVNLPATGYTLNGGKVLGWVNSQIYADGAALKIQTLDTDDAENGQITKLRWRAA